MGWSDFAVFVVPFFLALLLYIFVSGAKKSPPPNPSRTAQASPSLPIVSITANRILLDSEWSLSPSNRAIIESLSKRSTLYVIAIVQSMAEMRGIREILNREFEGIIPDDQILFCQTAMGRASMARQLEVTVHLDFDPETIRQVAIFHGAVLIAEKGVNAPAAACVCESLEQFANGKMKSLFPALAA
jgi:hypothetical protein